MTISATSQGLRPGVCVSTARPATPFDGQVIYETDTNRALVWDGSAWVYLATANAFPVGMLVAVPSTVSATGAGSSASVDANGKVTFSTAATLSVNGCFSSTFTNYRIVCDFDVSTNNDIDMRLRVGGTDNSTSNSYSHQFIYANGTTITGNRVTGTSMRVSGGNTTATNGISVDIYRPFLADTTAYCSNNANPTSSAFFLSFTGTHNQNTSYDGFSLICTTGNFTGSITVYGYVG